MAKNTTLTTASVLAFERKLDPSDALLHAGRWSERDTGNWQPVPIREKSVRGTISNRLKTRDRDPAKLDASIQAPNLQTVDVAALPADADTLRVRFTLRVLGGAGTPSACNDAEYQAKLLATVQNYVSEQGFAELGRRYAANLANGRFLWRNRVGAEAVDVRIARLQNGEAIQSWMFDGLALPLRNFAAHTEVDSLGQVIADGLAGKGHLLLEVVAFVRIGDGQEVFPSQELILDRGDKGARARRSTRYAMSPPSTHRKSATPCAPSTPGTRMPANSAPSPSSLMAPSPPRARPIANPGTRPTSTACSTPGYSTTPYRARSSSTM